MCLLSYIASILICLNEFPSRSGSSSQQFVLCLSKFGNPGSGRKGTEDCLEKDQACSRTHRDLVKIKLYCFEIKY